MSHRQEDILGWVHLTKMLRSCTICSFLKKVLVELFSSGVVKIIISINFDEAQLSQFLIFECEGLFLESVDGSNVFFNILLKFIELDQE